MKIYLFRTAIQRRSAPSSYLQITLIYVLRSIIIKLRFEFLTSRHESVK